MSEVLIKTGGNRAISVNPPSGLDIHLTKHGSDWLWAVAAIFGLFAVVYAVFFFVAEVKGTALTRYAIAAPFLISLFEFFFYFTYASNLGWTSIQAEFNHVTVSPSVTGYTPGIRQIFYSKFVAWFLSWPLLLFLLELSSVSTTSLKTETVSVLDMSHSLLIQIFATYFWIISLLVGALIRSSYKWGYWTFGAVSMLIVEGILVRRHLFVLKTRAFSAAMLIIILVIVWLYFICWGLSEGGNRIQPDSEAVFYGILDLCVFAVYPAFLLFIVNQFGTWPNFSLRGGLRQHHNDEEIPYEKPSGPTSIRASGETTVPRSHHNTEVHPATTVPVAEAPVTTVPVTDTTV